MSNCTPCLGQRGQKTIPCRAARPRIAQIREYPSPPGFSRTQITGKLCFREQQLRDIVSVLYYIGSLNRSLFIDYLKFE